MIFEFELVRHSTLSSPREATFCWFWHERRFLKPSDSPESLDLARDCELLDASTRHIGKIDGSIWTVFETCNLIFNIQRKTATFSAQRWQRVACVQYVCLRPHCRDQTQIRRHLCWAWNTTTTSKTSPISDLHHHRRHHIQNTWFIGETGPELSSLVISVLDQSYWRSKSRNSGTESPTRQLLDHQVLGHLPILHHPSRTWGCMFNQWLCELGYQWTFQTRQIPCP